MDVPSDHLEAWKFTAKPFPHSRVVLFFVSRGFEAKRSYVPNDYGHEMENQ